MMQVQSQTQQIFEEEFLLPLSEDQLASIAGGAAPPTPIPPPPHILSGEEIDAIKREAHTAPRRRNPLDQLEQRLRGPVRRGSFLGFFFA